MVYSQEGMEEHRQNNTGGPKNQLNQIIVSRIRPVFKSKIIAGNKIHCIRVLDQLWQAIRIHPKCQIGKHGNHVEQKSVISQDSPYATNIFDLLWVPYYLTGSQPFTCQQHQNRFGQDLTKANTTSRVAKNSTAINSPFPFNASTRGSWMPG